MPRRFRRDHALWMLYVVVSALSWAGFVIFWAYFFFFRGTQAAH